MVRRALLLLAPLVACSEPMDPLDQALSRGLAYLAAHQGADGGWRSEHYGVLKPGYSLTATILYVVGQVPEPLRAKYSQDIQRAFAFLHEGTEPAGAIGLGGELVDYPNYTSAFYTLALSSLRPTGWQALARRQVTHLREVQLTERQGWQPEDIQYGGFSWGGRTQEKPLGADLLNLSVTAIVLEALRAAGVAPDDEAMGKGSVFVERCQRFDGDGGFFFTTYPEFDRSKAGFITLADGTSQPRSYGSTTCDGIRALLSCGHPVSSPRVQAALSWLEDRFTLEETPGFHGPSGKSQEEALRLYYYASLAGALSHAQVSWPWRSALTGKILGMQRPDGSWVGLSDLMKEDDPLVATPLALMALSHARN